MKIIDGKMSIPIIVVYPEFGQFDLIAKTAEHQKIGDCLAQLFENPLPWDSKNEYNTGSIALLGEVEEGVLLRLPRQATIAELASRMVVRGAL